MRLVLLVMLLMMCTPLPARATEREAPLPETQVARLAPLPVAEPTMRLAPVATSEQSQVAREVIAAQEMPRRGGLMWVVAALVVAAVILVAVLA